MKFLKSLTAALFILIAVFAFSNNCYAANEGFGLRIYTQVFSAGIIKPRPGFFWVEGHYKINRYGRMVWVPGHWNRF